MEGKQQGQGFYCLYNVRASGSVLELGAGLQDLMNEAAGAGLQDLMNEAAGAGLQDLMNEAAGGRSIFAADPHPVRTAPAGSEAAGLAHKKVSFSISNDTIVAFLNRKYTKTNCELSKTGMFAALLVSYLCETKKRC